MVSVYTLRGDQLPKMDIKTFITGKRARKIQILYIKPYGEVTETPSHQSASSTITTHPQTDEYPSSVHKV